MEPFFVKNFLTFRAKGPGSFQEESRPWIARHFLVRNGMAHLSVVWKKGNVNFFFIHDVNFGLDLASAADPISLHDHSVVMSQLALITKYFRLSIICAMAEVIGPHILLTY